MNSEALLVFVFVGMSILLWMEATEVDRLRDRLNYERDMTICWERTAKKAMGAADGWKDKYDCIKSVTPKNPYAHLLGKVVEAKVYEASSWERMVVVAVSWKGAVAVRRVSDPEGKARWIRKNQTRERVRMVDE